LKIVVFVIVIAVAGLLSFQMYPKRVSGDKFRELVVGSYGSSNTTWYLYKEVADEYCFKQSTGLRLPRRYCVSKRDLKVANGKNGNSELGFMRENEFELRADRFPGAAQEVF
jgi:hypothetical protein